VGGFEEGREFKAWGRKEKEVGGFEEGREFKAWGRKEKEDRAFNANTKP
jgi:hypothetical protein